MTDAAAETIRRSCPTCEACCGLLVAIDRDRREVLSIKGDPDDHRSRGYVCAKSQAFRHVYEDPERLREPMRRDGGRWRPISWEAGLDMAAERLTEIREKHGKDAVALYVGNPTGHNFGSALYLPALMNFFQTERFFSAGTVDQHPQQMGSWALYGQEWFFPIPDIDHTDLFIVMGANPMVSQGSLMGTPDVPARLAALRARGGRCVVIDPRRTETAQVADEHLFIRPGTDAFMLLAFVTTLFESGQVRPGRLAGRLDHVDRLREMAAPFTPETVAPATGMPAAALRRLVAEYAATPKAALYARIGLCTQEFGTVASWLVDAISILAGKLDERGGMMFPRPAHSSPALGGDAGEAPYRRWRSRVRGFPETCGELPASLMAEEIMAPGDGKVHAAVTFCGNPVLSVPNGQRLREAFASLDFMLSMDIYLNETTSLANLILPSTTQLEHCNYDMLFGGTTSRNYAFYSPRAFEPEEGNRDQWQVLCELSARLHGIGAKELDDAMFDAVMDQAVAGAKKVGRQLDKDRIRAVVGADSGPERMLDVLVRNGPYGAGFDSAEGDESQGLSLAMLKAGGRRGAVDLGPMQPCLPEALRTPGQRIALMHEIIEDDWPRLQRRFGEHITASIRDKTDGLLLIGRRHIRDMNSWLHNLRPFIRGKNRCTLLVHPQDAERRRLRDGDQATLRSNVGEQRVTVQVTDEMMPGVVSLPHGFGHVYAGTGQSEARSRMPGVSCNDLIDPGLLDVASGTSAVNGVPVTLAAA